MCSRAARLRLLPYGALALVGPVSPDLQMVQALWESGGSLGSTSPRLPRPHEALFVVTDQSHPDLVQKAGCGLQASSSSVQRKATSVAVTLEMSPHAPREGTEP